MTSPPRAYASLLRRHQALVVDAVLYAVILVAALFAPGVLELQPGTTRIILIAMIAFFLLYEPVLVSLKGGTLGHHVLGLRVVDADSGERIHFGRSLIRTFVKGFLGIISFMAMLVSRRAQAIHDLASDSVVIVADAAHAASIDLASPASPGDEAGLPSKPRRVVVIMAYSAATIVVLLIMLALMVTPACFDTERCTMLESLWMEAVGWVWLAATACFVIYGWRGKLFGARARAVKPPAQVSVMSPHERF